MKKAICLCLVFTMVLLSSAQPVSASKNEILYNESSTVITLLEENDKYQKLKIEDKNNEKTEYLECYLQEDGSYIYKATTPDGIYIIEKHYNEILITNEINEIIQRISLENTDNFFYKELDILHEEQNEMEAKLPSYCIEDTSWKRTIIGGNTSKAIELTHLSLIIGVVAFITGLGPLESLVATIAQWLYATLATNVYYYYEEQNRFLNGWLEKRQYTAIYKNSDYNNIVYNTYSDPYRMHYVGSPCR